MRLSRALPALFLIFALSLSAEDAFAKGGFRGGSSSRGSSYSGSSSSFRSGGGGSWGSKPSTYTQSGGHFSGGSKPSAYTQSGGHFSGGSNTSASPKAKGFSTSSSFGQNSYTTYHDRQAAAQSFNNRKSEISAVRESTSFHQYTGGRSYTPRTIVVSRTSYYNNTPVFGGYYHRYSGWWGGCYNCYYGGFDPGFLMVMLMSDHPSSAALWYGLSGNPWFSIWMSQAREKAHAQSDPAVIARLDRIEAGIKAQKEQGAKPQSVEQTLQTMQVPPEVAYTVNTLTTTEEAPQTKKGSGRVWLMLLILGIGGGIIYLALKPTRRPNPFS
jgi:hypothetical protein